MWKPSWLYRGPWPIAKGCRSMSSTRSCVSICTGAWRFSVCTGTLSGDTGTPAPAAGPPGTTPGCCVGRALCPVAEPDSELPGRLAAGGTVRREAIEAAERIRGADPGQAAHVLRWNATGRGIPPRVLVPARHCSASRHRGGLPARHGPLRAGTQCLSLGRFDDALEAAARAGAIGEALLDRRLQTFAAWTTGWVQATRGEWDAAIAACQRALETSSNPLNTALPWDGWATLIWNRETPLPARQPLEQAMQSLHQFGYRRLEGLYTTLLGEVHLLGGHRDTAAPGTAGVERQRNAISHWHCLGSSALWSYRPG